MLDDLQCGNLKTVLLVRSEIMFGHLTISKNTAMTKSKPVEMIVSGNSNSPITVEKF